MTQGGMEWSYAGLTGPEHWASLVPEYAPCGQGVRQSPVDISGYERANAPALSFSYDGEVSGAALVRGSVVVEFGPGSGLTLEGRRYELQSAHAHAPAEHRVDGEGFAAELHLVHEDASGEALVVGVLYRPGPPSPVLQAMLDAAAGDAAAFRSGAASFTPGSAAFYSYTGSKTTPPCHEPVEWVVMRDAETVSPEQVDVLQSFSGGPNNRPLQPLRGRRIVLVEG
ncbi:MAG: carbonic anhydrase family protein [Chloroflexota bacterium]|nr:carbonic anhydrase family protein [Chloroflexota bacterium]MDE2884094.1 carbonic anhydrase family protein [Chloroflexota bacterium]